MLALAGPANADNGQVTHIKISGDTADAFWFTRSATGYAETFLTVSKTKQDSRLFVEQTTVNTDANGDVTGGTDTIASVTSGFSFAEKQSLASASLSGPSLPATTCTINADFQPISCGPTAIDVTVAWTGQGEILSGGTHTHTKGFGFSVNMVSHGATREATATGTVAGLTVSTGVSPDFADIGTNNSGLVSVCIGNSC